MAPDRTPPPAASSNGYALLVVQRDAEVAGRWRDALLDAGIEARLEIRDGLAFSPTSSAYPTGAPFVYLLAVPVADREAAAALLIDLGWDGRAGISGGGGHLGGARAVRGALAAVASAGRRLARLLLFRGG